MLNYLVDGTVSDKKQEIPKQTSSLYKKLPTTDLLCQIDFGQDVLFPKGSTTGVDKNETTPDSTTNTNSTTDPDACTPLSDGPASGKVSGALGDDAADEGAIDALKSENRTLRIVISVLACISAILLLVIAFLLHRGRKGVKYAPVSLRGDYPGNYEKRDFPDPYAPESRYSTES